MTLFQIVVFILLLTYFSWILFHTIMDRNDKDGWGT